MNMVRAAIERLYKGLCSVKVKVSSVNEETGETVFTEKAVLRNSLADFHFKAEIRRQRTTDITLYRNRLCFLLRLRLKYRRAVK